MLFFGVRKRRRRTYYVVLCLAVLFNSNKMMIIELCLSKEFPIFLFLLFTELLLVPYGFIYSARIICINIVSMSIMYHCMRGIK